MPRRRAFPARPAAPSPRHHGEELRPGFYAVICGHMQSRFPLPFIITACLSLQHDAHELADGGTSSGPFKPRAAASSSGPSRPRAGAPSSGPSRPRPGAQFRRRRCPGRLPPVARRVLLRGAARGAAGRSADARQAVCDAAPAGHARGHRHPAPGARREPGGRAGAGQPGRARGTPGLAAALRRRAPPPRLRRVCLRL